MEGEQSKNANVARQLAALLPTINEHFVNGAATAATIVRGDEPVNFWMAKVGPVYPSG